MTTNRSLRRQDSFPTTSADAVARHRENVKNARYQTAAFFELDALCKSQGRPEGNARALADEIYDRQVLEERARIVARLAVVGPDALLRELEGDTLAETVCEMMHAERHWPAPSSAAAARPRPPAPVHRDGHISATID
jgi:hypothetical protein